MRTRQVSPERRRAIIQREVIIVLGAIGLGIWLIVTSSGAWWIVGATFVAMGLVQAGFVRQFRNATPRYVRLKRDAVRKPEL